MSIPLDRPSAKVAGPELLIVARWEEVTAWFLDHAAKWPKAARFTLTQRAENHVLDVMEQRASRDATEGGGQRSWKTSTTRKGKFGDIRGS